MMKYLSKQNGTSFQKCVKELFTLLELLKIYQGIIHSDVIYQTVLLHLDTQHEEYFISTEGKDYCHQMKVQFCYQCNSLSLATSCLQLVLKLILISLSISAKLFLRVPKQLGAKLLYILPQLKPSMYITQNSTSKKRCNIAGKRGMQHVP